MRRATIRTPIWDNVLDSDEFSELYLFFAEQNLKLQGSVVVFGKFVRIKGLLQQCPGIAKVVRHITEKLFDDGIAPKGRPVLFRFLDFHIDGLMLLSMLEIIDQENSKRDFITVAVPLF